MKSIFFSILFTILLYQHSSSQVKSGPKHTKEANSLLLSYENFINATSNDADFLVAKSVYVAKPYRDSTDNPYFDLLSLRNLYEEKFGADASIIFNKTSTQISDISVDNTQNTYHCQLFVPQQIRYMEIQTETRDSSYSDSLWIDSILTVQDITIQVIDTLRLKKVENSTLMLYITMSYKSNINDFTDYKVEAVSFNKRPYKHQPLSILSSYWVSLDENWKAMISERLKFPELATDYYLDRIDGIHDLDLSKSEITNFEPLKGFKYLKELNLSNRPLDTLLAIEHCTALEILNISNCGLRSLHGLEKMTKLTSLSAAKNEIEDLSPISGATDMIYLSLDENRIKDISPLSQMRILQKLHLDLNLVESLEPLRGMLILSELFIKKNKDIESLEPLRGHRTLYKLDCFNTSITSLDPIKDDIRMVHLDCGYTKINTLDPIKNYSELRHLSFCGNSIADYSILNRLDKLRYLNCSSTNISDINLISRMDNLKELMAPHTDFTKNDIQKFKKNHPKVAITYY